MAHKLHLYDPEGGYDEDGFRRPVETLEFDDPDEAIEKALASVREAGTISRASLKADWRICDSLEVWFRVENAIGHWLAENPMEGMWTGTLVEDLHYWSDMGVYTPEDIEKHLLLSGYSDNHKAIYGFRPRDTGMTMETPIEELEAAYDALCANAGHMNDDPEF